MNLFLRLLSLPFAWQPGCQRSASWGRAGLLAGLLFVLAGCADMQNQPRYEPLEASDFFPDQRASRPLVDGVVPRGVADQYEAPFTGRGEGGELLDSYPFEITQEVLERGQERYDIYCAPCHGLDGYGEGIIVQRGFPQPQSFHQDRLREAPAAYYYDVITNGFGRMYSYAYRVKPDDRWAITAYIRALQLSQNATENEVPPEELPGLEEGTP